MAIQLQFYRKDPAPGSSTSPKLIPGTGTNADQDLSLGYNWEQNTSILIVKITWSVWSFLLNLITEFLDPICLRIWFRSRSKLFYHYQRTGMLVVFCVKKNSIE
jgi:hypothetical protein